MALLPCVQSGIRYDSEEGEERVLHICTINSESKKILTTVANIINSVGLSKMANDGITILVFC